MERFSKTFSEALPLNGCSRASSALLLVCMLALGACDGNMSAAAGDAYASARQALQNRLHGKPPTADRNAVNNKRRKNRQHLVELVQVKSEPLHITSVYSGSLRARKLVRIHTQEEGRISDVAYFEGDRVTAGQRLFAIDDTLLRVALDKADAVLAEARANIKRLDALRKRRLVGEDEFLRAQTAALVANAERRLLQTRLGFTAVAAPFDGVVTARRVEPGDVVARHQHIMTVIDPMSLTIDIWAAERLVANLNSGDSVRVRIDALGVEDHPGEVLRVYPQLNSQTRQGRVEIALQPVPKSAQSGQFARVTFDIDTFARTVIPFGALRRDRDAEYVFVVGEDNVAKRAVVRSGRRVADKVEILDGLAPRQQVVLRGFLGLTAGKRVVPVTGAEDKGSDRAAS
jgi:RND family efflux transporter MFP subunit